MGWTLQEIPNVEGKGTGTSSRTQNYLQNIESQICFKTGLREVICKMLSRKKSLYVSEETHSKKVLHVEGAGRDWTKFKVSSNNYDLSVHLDSTQE